MKKSYMSVQTKQFLFSTLIVGGLAVGFSVTNSMDSEYVAKLEAYQKSVKTIAESEKDKENQEDLEVGMVE